MLAHLRVSNLGVLADASIDPSPGLTVITGETGAGKTLLLGGLRLVLGGPADARAVGPHDTMARVDALFVTDGEIEIGAGRTVPMDGRSRANLEGGLVSAAKLEETLGALVEIVGQHDQLSLTRPAHVLELIDGPLGRADPGAIDAYQSAWQAWQEVRGRQARLGGDQVELARELDLARYQSSEIAAAGLSPGLDEELEISVSRLRNVEEITEHLAETMRLAEGMSERVGEMVARLRKAAGLDPSLGDLAGQADLLAEAVADVARLARVSADDLDADPTGLEELEGRLTAIGDLKRKYGRTIEEVIGHGERITDKAAELEGLLADADRIDAEVAHTSSALATCAADLSKARTKAAKIISAEMRSHLADLGLIGAKVEIELEPVDPGPTGADRVVIRFASDPRLETRPIADAASGGELSRLVLAIRLATKSKSTATLVFDEVDTGIGGKTALAMGAKLADLARDRQVLCVTHLAQVAAHADTHYVVERDAGGVAHLRHVIGDDRVTEIARMLAGQPDSLATKTAAAELLATVL